VTDFERKGGGQAGPELGSFKELQVMLFKKRKKKELEGGMGLSVRLTIK